MAAPSVLVLFAVFHQIGATWPAPTWYFLADAWIFVGSILATYGMARGWVDFWLSGSPSTSSGVPELLYFELYPTAVLYGVYGVFVVVRVPRLAPDRPRRAALRPG